MSITKQDAEAIATKLHAKIVTSKKAHDQALIYYNGKLIALFGIRRGSQKDAGHGHIPKNLYLPQSRCVKLAECTFSEKDWLEHMKSIGKLPA